VARVAWGRAGGRPHRHHPRRLPASIPAPSTASHGLNLDGATVEVTLKGPAQPALDALPVTRWFALAAATSSKTCCWSYCHGLLQAGASPRPSARRRPPLRVVRRDETVQDTKHGASLTGQHRARSTHSGTHR